MLKRRSPTFLLLLVVATLLTSCSVERRHYRNGFYVSRAHHETVTAVAGSAAEAESDTLPSSKVTPEAIALQIPCIDSAEAMATGVAPESFSRVKEEALPEQMNDAQSILTEAVRDEPVSTEKDHLNPVVLLLTVLGFFLIACLLLIAVPYLPFWAVVVFCCLPLLGVLSFGAALLYRRKTERDVAQGKQGNKYRLSAYFSKFKGLLSTFFTAVLIGLLGFALIYSTGFGSSLIVLFYLGLLMLGAAATVINVLSVILVVFALLYLFRWRKYPDGNPPSLFKRKPKADRAKAGS